ncbi:MAG: glycerol kinase GlpK [Caldilineaceae bacterium]
MPFLLGIDQGTTQTTAVVVDEHGTLVAKHSVPLPVRFPRPDWVEQDPWAIVATVRAAVAPLLDHFEIAAVGFDNQGETFLLWDAASGQPLTPAVVWQDKRAQALCTELATTIDPGWLQQKTGLRLDTYFSAPKLRFILEQDADLRRAVEAGRARFGTTESWVIWQLTHGRVHVTDPSTASRTLFFDLNRLQWDDELLALFGLPRVCLPDVVPSAGYVGELNFGLARTYPLYALLVDQQAALFGQACLEAGDMKCTFGTGTFLLMNTGSTPRLSQQGLLTTVAWQIGETVHYALDGGDFVAGAAVQWLVENAAFLPDAAASHPVAQQASDPDILFVPTLAGLGAPHWQPQARGTLFGISRATTQADIVRATLEGIACRVYDIVKAIEQDAGYPLTRLKVDGGPAANPTLMQLLADLLGIEIQVAAAEEATAMGVANLAGHAALGIATTDLRQRWRAQAVYQPALAPAERERRLARWQRALAALRVFY